MTLNSDWNYDAWLPADDGWTHGLRHDHEDEGDVHLDIGCGTTKKARIGIDRFAAPGVNVVMDLNSLHVYSICEKPNTDAPLPDRAIRHQQPQWLDDRPYAIARGLPFEDNSIESAISHHCLEHIGDGFIMLMDEVYRVLVPGGVFRVITPLFPSTAAVADPDHRRYFMDDTFDSFCGHSGSADNPTGCWLDSFSVPYTKSRFEITNKDVSPLTPHAERWGPTDVREIRVSLQAHKR